METPYRQWLWEKTGAKCVENLQKHGFDAYLAENRQAAAERVLGLLSGFQSVGFGGSDTVRALGLVETLKEMGKTV